MPETSRFDVVIVGAGPAGLYAAAGAAGATSSIAMIDQAPAPGGQIWRRDVTSGYPEGRQDFVERTAAQTTFIGNASVVDAVSAGGRHELLVESAGRAFSIETGTLILATGARELFLPFPGWTLPGVMGAGGLQAMMKSGFDVRGKRVVIAGTGPLLVAVAATAAKKGAEVVAVLEQAPLGSMVKFGLRVAVRPVTAIEALGHLQQLGGGVMKVGSWVTAAAGQARVERVFTSDGQRTSAIECDVLATGYGLIPNTELARRLGCRLGPRGIEVDGAQRTSIPGILAAGECTGIAGVYPAFLGGMAAGRVAVKSPRADLLAKRRRSTWGDILDQAFALRPEVLRLARPETIICRCEDVRLRDIDSASSARQAKLYARAGMGACQGRVCGAALQQMFGWETDTVRAPLQPVALSSLLGAR